MAVRSEFCPNCFQKIKGQSQCPHCNYDCFERENQLALPMNALLNGRYVAGRILGAGGFGITYKAYDLVTNQLCAVKEYVPLGYANRHKDRMTLTPTSVEKEEVFNHGKKKFLDEANILVDLHYISSVVEVIDCFGENGTAYFVMEYLDGATLNQLRGSLGGKLPFNYAYDVIRSVAYCLREVHTKANIFHRDISPENIMIKQDGQIKVIDFGTAKYIHGQKSQNLSIVLKPGFAPPEQYSSSGKQGGFTDVYALAATFYFILTGKKVPAAPDRIGGGAEVEPIDRIMGSGYKGLAELLDRALRIKIAERTQTMGEFIREIENFKKHWDKETGSDSPSTVVEIKKKNAEDFGKGKNSLSRGSTKSTTEQQMGHSDRRIPVHNKKKSRSRVHPYLDGVSGPVKGYRYPLPVNTMITLGRSRASNITIPLSVIGRKHVELFYDTYNGLFFIVDNHSVNGTYINGVKCEPDAITPVKPGSILSLAQNSCVFQLGVVNEK